MLRSFYGRSWGMGRVAWRSSSGVLLRVTSNPPPHIVRDCTVENFIAMQCIVAKINLFFNKLGFVWLPSNVYINKVFHLWFCLVLPFVVEVVFHQLLYHPTTPPSHQLTIPPPPTMPYKNGPSNIPQHPTAPGRSLSRGAWWCAASSRCCLWPRDTSTPPSTGSSATTRLGTPRQPSCHPPPLPSSTSRKAIAIFPLEAKEMVDSAMGKVDRVHWSSLLSCTELVFTI